jgi:hypothetical protein
MASLRIGDGYKVGLTDARSGRRVMHVAATLALLLVAADATPQTVRATPIAPHRSATYLPFSNGVGTAAFDATRVRLTHFFEHAYRYERKDATSGQYVESRNFAYDSYLGVRNGATGRWLSDAAIATEYVPATGIVHVAHEVDGLVIDQYHFAPADLAEPVTFMLAKVTRRSGSTPVDLYALFNYHLGAGSPLPGTADEEASFAATRDAFYEWGPSGATFAYASLTPLAHHASTPAENPYAALQAGHDLADNAGTEGKRADAAVGLQVALGALAVGETAWSGFFTATSSAGDVQPIVDRVKQWIGTRTAEQLLAAEIDDWSHWLTPAPPALSAREQAVYAQAQVMLRMGQVRDGGGGDGQMLASLAPGDWPVAWVRDMAYAVVGLARTGHDAEAKRAIAFQLGAKAGAYQTQVGRPYRLSVVRYMGNGDEESDSNADGPNIEFDGFGLFLWELGEYLRASGDSALLTSAWPVVRDEIAAVLTSLQEPSGLIAADSSIWEVHWNGKQEHFAYTTLAAARGLCEAATFADRMADPTHASTFGAAGRRARDALLSLRAPDGSLAQSQEALARGARYLDAAPLEAINFGLLDPARAMARATLRAIRGGLVPASGRGFFRNQNGGDYDSQEWVFVDLRAARALSITGDSAAAADLLAWNVDQATENFGIFAELHDRMTADYRGAIPMVGFGAGAYVLAMLDRGVAEPAPCGGFAPEPPVDDGDAGIVDAATDARGGAIDGGASPEPPLEAGTHDASADPNTDAAARDDAIVDVRFDIATPDGEPPPSDTDASSDAKNGAGGATRDSGAPRTDSGSRREDGGTSGCSVARRSAEGAERTWISAFAGVAIALARRSRIARREAQQNRAARMRPTGEGANEKRA